MGFKEWFIPQDKIFFDLFEQQAAVVTEAAQKLVDLTEDFTNVKEKRHKIEQLEHRGDQITHDIYEQLNRTFITPLEPEEISRLASTLDEVLDYIDGVTEKMFYYGIEATDAHMVELAKIIRMQTVELEGAVKGIRSIKDPKYIEDRCIETNRKVIRDLITASDGCRAALEAHVRMRNAKLEAEQLAEQLAECMFASG